MALLEIGVFARDALARGGGEVCALFRRSLYLRCSGGRYVCIGDRSLGRGPLNALAADWGRFGALAPGDRCSPSIRGARLWRAARPRAAPLDRFGLRARLCELGAAAAERAPRDGLGSAIGGTPSSLVRYARPALCALDRWLAGAVRGVPHQTGLLLGLGPGLTPSGDDYLAGMLVALRAFGRRRFAAALGEWIAGRAAARTSAISGAHLAAAAAGEAHEALHACLDALLGEGAPGWSERLAALERVGHCSGWDALAGVSAVARSASA